MLNRSVAGSGEQGAQKIVEAFGKCLADFTKDCMKKESGKPDDVVIFVGRINVHNAPCRRQAMTSGGNVADEDGFTEVYTSGPSEPEERSSAPSPIEVDSSSTGLVPRSAGLVCPVSLDHGNAHPLSEAV
eukprot:948007-Rhodomonas_salina.1